MYIVHCRVIIDNMCEFQHCSSHVDCNFDARLVSYTVKYRSTKKKTGKARLPTDSCLNNSKRPSLVKLHFDQSRVSKRSPMARVQTHPDPDTTSICCLRHRALLGSKSSRQVGRSISVHKNFALHLAIALHLVLAVLLAIAVMIRSS